MASLETRTREHHLPSRGEQQISASLRQILHVTVNLQANGLRDRLELLIIELNDPRTSS